MKVRLIAYTPNPDKIAGAAARSCRSPRGAGEIVNDDDSKLLKSLKICIELGHTSVVEHASFTFSVEGVSRACTHELVRHRIASYSQQSQRVVKSGEKYIIPPSISRDRKGEKSYAELMKSIWKAYDELVNDGIPTEDARYVLPNATETNIVVTMNARSLINFFRQRCCEHAQWEIRGLAYEMLKQVKKVAPAIFAKVGPYCIMDEICRENDKSCRLYPRKREK